jgi:hypothetical protein
MNEIPADSSFNDNFQILVKDKNSDKIRSVFNQALTTISLEEISDELLKTGIQLSILRAIITLLDLDLNPISKELAPEYKVLLVEIKEAYEQLHPDKQSNWLEECISYGDKKAYHWDWKHFGSKELF